MRQAGVGDAVPSEDQGRELAQAGEMAHLGVGDGTAQVQAQTGERLHAGEVGQDGAGHLGRPEVEMGEIRVPSEMGHAGVGDLRVRQIQIAELDQPGQVPETGSGHPRTFEVEGEELRQARQAAPGRRR